MKKRGIRGAIMLEAAICLILNATFIMGALEIGWYLYSKQGVTGAAREAVRTDDQTNASRMMKKYLHGLDYPNSFINSIKVDFEKYQIEGPTETKLKRVTAKVPVANMLLFGGKPSQLIVGLDVKYVTIAAYERINDLDDNKDKEGKGNGGKGRNK